MIDYGMIDLSIQYYEDHKYQRIESPWTVTPQVDDITRPVDKVPFEIKYNNKRLVASGEQSFLYLYMKGFLPKGRFQTVTPCFRNEAFDDLHTKYFIKNELIITDEVTDSTLNVLRDQALQFFRMFIPDANWTMTKDGYDIVIDGHELGSYGIRECSFLKWVYGTGCAEPRLSHLTKLYGISQKRDT